MQTMPHSPFVRCVVIPLTLGSRKGRATSGRLSRSHSVQSLGLSSCAWLLNALTCTCSRGRTADHACDSYHADGERKDTPPVFTRSNHDTQLLGITQMRKVRDTVTMFLLTLLVGCSSILGPGGTHIRIQGVVTAAGDGAPIQGATVEVGTMTWSTDGVFLAVKTDSFGRYSLNFVEEDYCPGSLFVIRASKEGFRMQRMTKMGFGSSFEGVTAYIRCTEDLQRIDFSLLAA